MDFGLTEEQRLIVETTRAFVENELYPHEAEVERTGHLRAELVARDQGTRRSRRGSMPPTCRRRSAAPGSIR